MLYIHLIFVDEKFVVYKILVKSSNNGITLGHTILKPTTDLFVLFTSATSVVDNATIKINIDSDKCFTTYVYSRVDRAAL